MAFRHKVFGGRNGRLAEKGERRAICSKETEAGSSISQEGGIEVMEDGFQRFGPEFGALLVKGGSRRGISL